MLAYMCAHALTFTHTHTHTHTYAVQSAVVSFLASNAARLGPFMSETVYEQASGRSLEHVSRCVWL
jgi:hypothetical protein